MASSYALGCVTSRGGHGATSGWHRHHFLQSLLGHLEVDFARMQTLYVYVIHWKAPNECLRAISAIHSSRGLKVSVVVVDNSPQNDPPLQELIPDEVRLIAAPENLGFTGGANLAFADWLTNYSNEEFVVIANHDTQPDPDALKLLIEALREDPLIGAAGPSFRVESAQWKDLRGMPAEHGPGTWDGTRPALLPVFCPPGSQRAAQWLKGELTAFRGTAVQEVGGFDERFGSYVEDVDIGLRLNDAGWRTVAIEQAQSTSGGSGPISPQVRVLLNSVLLSAKRDRLAGLSKSICRLVSDLARYTVIAARWRARAPEVRRRARTQAVERITVLARLVGTAGVLFDMLQKPNRGSSSGTMRNSISSLTGREATSMWN